MKRIILILVFSIGVCGYSQTFVPTAVTSNKDGTPDNHYIPDTAMVIQTYRVSSKRLLGIGKSAEAICIPVKSMVEIKIEPIRVTDQKFKKD